MLRLDLICSLLTSFGLLTGCSSDSATTPVTPALKYVRYSGTIHQPTTGADLIVKMSGVWTFDASGTFIRGADTVVVLDASAYGIPGATTMTGTTRCAVISGKEAWAEGDVLTSTQPQFFPTGTSSVTHLLIANGVPTGGSGPKDFWYPTGNLCTDKPAGYRAYPLEGGTLTFP